MAEAGTNRLHRAPVRRRVAWGLLDQVVSSASNFLVTILAARALSAADFGVFTLGMAGAIVAVALTRGLASDPLATSHAGDGEHRLRRAVRSGAAAALWPTLVAALGLAVAGAVLGGTVGSVALVLGIVLPGVVLQDYLRYALIVRREPRRTFHNDLVWLVILVPVLLLVTERSGGPAAMLLAWGLCGTACGLLGLAQVRALPGNPTSVRRWLRRHRKLWPYYTLDNLLHQLNGVGMLFAIALFTTTAQVGGVRAAMTIYAPLTLISRGVVSVFVPELARRRRQGRHVDGLSLRLALLMSGLGVVFAAATLLIPDAAGRALLGESWRYAGPVLFLAGITTAAGLFSAGVVVGIRALGAARHGLAGRAVISLTVLVAASVGAGWDGTRGVFVALAVSAPLQVAVWWRLLVRASRHPDHGLPPRDPQRMDTGQDGSAR